MFTMHMLFHKQECTVGDVSRMLSISNPAASQLLEHLVNTGTVERFESPHDRRVRLHKLTDKGVKMMKQGRSVKKGWYEAITDGMSNSELEKTAEALELLNSRAKHFGAFSGNHDHGGCE